MINQFYELAEMLSCSLFVLILVKMFHLVTLIMLNFYKLKKIDNIKNKMGNDNEKK